MNLVYSTPFLKTISFRFNWQPHKPRQLPKSGANLMECKHWVGPQKLREIHWCRWKAQWLTFAKSQPKEKVKFCISRRLAGSNNNGSKVGDLRSGPLPLVVSGTERLKTGDQLGPAEGPKSSSADFSRGFQLDASERTSKKSGRGFNRTENATKSKVCA